MKKKTIFLIIFSIFTLFISVKNVIASEETGTFTELQQLINENTTGKVILEKNYTNNGSESQITISKDITIDLNGYVINGRYINRIFNISTNANVVIDDSNKTAIHKFDVDQWSLATLNEESGAITINGGCITGGDVTSGSTNKTHLNGKGSGIYINAGSLTINSGNIIGNKVSDKYQFGAGIAAENGASITINGGMVSYNRATWEGYGGGIYLNNSDLTINGGTISYNYGIYGGGINVYDDSTLTVNGGAISNNIGGHNGGGIALMVLDANVASGVVSKATINGGTIENNTTVTPLVGVGGGICTCKGSDLTITGGNIQKNSAQRGGGVGAWTGGNIKIFGGTITENIALEDTDSNDGTSGNHGAGVFFNTHFISGYANVDAQLSIGGNAVITGNINAVSNKEDNLYLADGQKLTIQRDENTPKNGMNISINMETYGEFTTNGTLADAKYFSTDDEDYYIKHDSNILKVNKILSKPEYEFISGANQTYVINKSKEATFKINADYYLFKGKIYVDDILLESKDYTSEEGSTVIKLKKEFVDSLSIGKHTLKVSFSDSGEATTNFIIDKLKEDNPNTRDDIILYLIIGCISLISLVGCCSYIYVKTKKKKTNN